MHALSLLYMAATVVGLALVGIAIQAYYDLIESKEVYEQVLSQDNWQLQDLRNKEQWELTHYGYVDKNKGVVRVPIEQAMQAGCAGRCRKQTEVSNEFVSCQDGRRAGGWWSARGCWSRDASGEVLQRPVEVVRMCNNQRLRRSK